MIEEIKKEIRFEHMYHKGGHVPRLVAVQALISENGAVPIYRHPAEQLPKTQPFSPCVSAILAKLNTSQTFNHCLIQFYRNGHDFISEHSDKTLDINTDTDIINYSVGATRKLIIKPKIHEYGITNKISYYLENESVFVLTPEMNRTMRHEIKPDKRHDVQCGERISFTFRSIGTFMLKDGRIWGKGSKFKREEDLPELKEYMKIAEECRDDEYRDILHAFSRENKECLASDEIYGDGFLITNLA